MSETPAAATRSCEGCAAPAIATSPYKAISRATARTATIYLCNTCVRNRDRAWRWRWRLTD